MKHYKLNLFKKKSDYDNIFDVIINPSREKYGYNYINKDSNAQHKSQYN